MGLSKVRLFAFLAVPIGLAGGLEAAAQLRLVSSTVGPVSIVPGANGPTRSVEAYNIGDGSLNLSAKSSVSWISPSVSGSANCATTNLARTCFTINMALNTSSLAASTTPYTGIVTVSDSNAGTIDAPQTITVTVAVGGSVQSNYTFYVPPNGTASAAIPTNSNLFGKSSAPWLQLAVNGFGSFKFDYPFIVQATATSADPIGTYSGTLTLSGSNFAADNKTVNVTMNVTDQPIAQPSQSALNLTLAQGAAPSTYPFVPLISLGNIGQGTLTAGTPALNTTSCGSSWISMDSVYHVLTVDPTGLQTGVCNATLTLPSNAINGTQTMPISLTVEPKGNPTINYQGVVDNATATPGDSVCPGDILALKGDQLSLSAYTPGPAPPLPTQLADTKVLVNGTAAPLYYTSYGQIALQMPMNVSNGQALVQVQRTDGASSNIASVNVVPRAPRIVVITNAAYQLRDANNPTTAGETLILWSIGMGPTSPFVDTGQPAPTSEPFARLTTTPTISLNRGAFPVTITPDFAALSPGFAGLYQINVTIPSTAPKGVVSLVVGFPDGTVSNEIALAIQ